MSRWNYFIEHKVWKLKYANQRVFFLPNPALSHVIHLFPRLPRMPEQKYPAKVKFVHTFVLLSSLRDHRCVTRHWVPFPCALILFIALYISFVSPTISYVSIPLPNTDRVFMRPTSFFCFHSSLLVPVLKFRSHFWITYGHTQLTSELSQKTPRCHSNITPGHLTLSTAAFKSQLPRRRLLLAL